MLMILYLLIRPSDIQFVLGKFNSFDKNLKFTFDDFQDGNVHFLDLKITEDSIDIFTKTLIPASTPTFLALNLSAVKFPG